MIDDKLREAWNTLVRIELTDATEEIFYELKIIQDAFIEAEWQRRRAAFLLNHWLYSFDPDFCAECADVLEPHHNFADADWRRELEGELNAG